MTITRRMMVGAVLTAAFAPVALAQSLPLVKVQTNMGDFEPKQPVQMQQ